MIRLAGIAEQFGVDFIQKYQDKLLPSQVSTLNAIKNCRSIHSPKMQMECGDCTHQTFIPHSCGNRHCPHCQNHESQQWIERQLQKQVPADYFMLTFTLPAELRYLAWQHQRVVYGLLFDSVWKTLQDFTLNTDFHTDLRPLKNTSKMV
jgi:Transposase zinc-binding domain